MPYPAVLTFEGCVGLCLEKEPPAAGYRLLPDAVAQSVASTLVTTEALALVEGLHVFTPVTRTLLIAVLEGVDEQMNCPLVGTLHRLGEPW